MRNDSDDECEAWMLGNGEMFSAADISLGVILNRLALLGLRYIFWEGTYILQTVNFPKYNTKYLKYPILHLIILEFLLYKLTQVTRMLTKHSPNNRKSINLNQSNNLLQHIDLSSKSLSSKFSKNLVLGKVYSIWVYYMMINVNII